MTSRRSSGSIRAERAVEPTKSENITRDLAALGGVLGLRALHPHFLTIDTV